MVKLLHLEKVSYISKLFFQLIITDEQKFKRNLKWLSPSSHCLLHMSILKFWIYYLYLCYRRTPYITNNMGKVWNAIFLFNIILIKGIFFMMGLILQGLYTIAAKAIIFIPLWAVCEQEFMVCSIGNVIYIFGRAAYTWPKLHINQTQKTNILHPQNRIKSRKGLRHILYRWSCIHSLHTMCNRLYPFIHPTYFTKIKRP